MRHGGPFGEIREVPTLVLIDAQGRVAWTKTGLVKADEIRAAMRALPGK
jgi:predicted transcriptional regulator